MLAIDVDDTEAARVMGKTFGWGTDEELQKICDFLYRRTGMLFSLSKRYYVQRRIAERMSHLRIGSFATYFAYLRGDSDGEIEKFIAGRQ